MVKTKLTKGLWRSKKYYREARQGSLEEDHPGMVLLGKLAKKAGSILDLGCGEGTRLNILTTQGKKGVGIDVSRTAMNMAKKSFPALTFVKSDLANLPLKDLSFDLVYSAYVLEHLDHPEKAIEEALRVAKQKGSIVFIAPNYGAPNRASPPFKGSRVKKFFAGFFADLVRPSLPKKRLRWNKVVPNASVRHYRSDSDATIEPYLGSLIRYLKRKGFMIKKAMSCWDQELPGVKVHQIFFRFLGEAGVYPFWMWGPHLVVVAQK